MLGRVAGRVRHVRLSRVSPLAVPVLLDIGRETVRTAGGEDALLAETEALVAEATGDAEPSTAPLRVHPGAPRQPSDPAAQAAQSAGTYCMRGVA